MSKENVQNFYEFLQQNPATVEEMEKAAEGSECPEKARAFVIEFAKGKGFEFTAEDLAAFEEESQKELSLEELEKINAGAWGFCILLGIGWGDSEGGGRNWCRVIGIGGGVGWKDIPDPTPEEIAASNARIKEQQKHSKPKSAGFK